MHPSMWFHKKQPGHTKTNKQTNKQTLADPVPPSKFADTHTWVKGTVKGKIEMIVDDLSQARHKASNLACLKALEEH
eukprot:12894159-Prorocentrum_lima.AAC.1